MSKTLSPPTGSRPLAPHYQHSEIGYNYRLSNLLAGIGRGQLQVLEDRVQARRRNLVLSLSKGSTSTSRPSATLRQAQAMS